MKQVNSCNEYSTCLSIWPFHHWKCQDWSRFPNTKTDKVNSYEYWHIFVHFVIRHHDNDALTTGLEYRIHTQSKIRRRLSFLPCFRVFFDGVFKIANSSKQSIGKITLRINGSFVVLRLNQHIHSVDMITRVWVILVVNLSKCINLKISGV